MKQQIIEALETKGFEPRTQAVKDGEQVIANRQSSTIYFTIRENVKIHDVKKSSTSSKPKVTDLDGALTKIKRMKRT